MELKNVSHLREFEREFERDTERERETEREGEREFYNILDFIKPYAM